MNQYKIVISSDKNKPKFLNIKFPDPNCVNLGLALYNACSTEAFRALLKAHKVIPVSQSVKDRIAILVSFDTSSIKSLSSLQIRCPNQSHPFDNKKFLSEFKKLNF